MIGWMTKHKMKDKLKSVNGGNGTCYDSKRRKYVKVRRRRK